MYKYIESLKRKNNTTEIIFGVLLKVSDKKKNSNVLNNIFRSREPEIFYI